MTEQLPQDPDAVRDELPEDLNAAGYVGPYRFPDNSRRRIPGTMYLVIAAACFVLWLVRRDHDPVFVNRGMVLLAGLLAFVGLLSITSGWRLRIDEKEALVVATQAVGFPVGHASAQQVWRGLRARPTWRVLCYSAEEPPRRRGFVLVDAIDGRTLEQFIEDNPEQEWAPLTGSSAPTSTH